MSIRAQTLTFFTKAEFWDFKVFQARGDPWALGPAATHPPGTETETTETETTDTATRAAPIANAPRDRIRLARRFTSLTLIINVVIKPY